MTGKHRTQVNRVAEDLYTCGISYVRGNSTAEFDTVVTVCQDSTEDNVGGRHRHFNMADGPEVGIVGGDSSYELFEEACDYVRERLDDGDAVLVHCHHGRSRSVSVASAVHAIREAKLLEYERDGEYEPDPDVWAHAKRYVEEQKVTA